MTGVHVTGGVDQHAGAQQLAKLNARMDAAYSYATKSKQHLWIATTTYQVSDHALQNIGREPLNLDLETMLMQPALGCYVCEQPYSPRLRLRKCPGEPAPG
jgi:hypothetical protein